MLLLGEEGREPVAVFGGYFGFEDLLIIVDRFVEAGAIVGLMEEGLEIEGDVRVLEEWNGEGGDGLAEGEAVELGFGAGGGGADEDAIVRSVCANHG